MIVAIGGGELGEQTSAVDAFVVRASGKASPRVLFFPTASKDAPGYAEKVQQHFSAGWGCEVRTVSLLANPRPDAVEALMAWADVVYVGGGDTFLLLRTWNRYSMADRCRRALDRGAVLAGVSAGAICWFDGGIAAYNRYKPIPGLGLAPGLVLPHFEPGNRAALDGWFAEEPAREVFGIGDGAALTWDGHRHGAVSSAGEPGVWRVQAPSLEPL